MSLLLLPLDITLLLLSFLQIIDIGKFDNAICNRDGRLLFWNVCNIIVLDYMESTLKCLVII